MKRASFIRLIVLCATLCTLGTAGPFRATPVYAGHMMNDSCTDTSDSFDVNAYIGVDSSDDLYTDSYVEVEFDSCDDITQVEIDETVSGHGVAGPPYDMEGGDYAEVDPSFSASPGYEYDVEADGYAYYDLGDPEEEGGWQYVGSDAGSVDVPGIPVDIASIDPEQANAGDPVTITLVGMGFGTHPTVTTDACCIQIINSYIATGTVSGSTSLVYTIHSDVQISQNQPPGTVNFIVTNQDGGSDNAPFTLLPVISQLNPSFATQGTPTFTLQIIGAGFGTSPAVNFSAPGVHIGTPTPVSNTEIDLSVSIDPNAPVTSYPITVTSNGQTSNAMTFSVTAAPLPPGPPPDPCAVTSNPNSGFSLIVPTSTTGGNGSMTVSFSGAAFSAISPSVTYGPFSTPSSIAASIAATITRYYLRYGLTAKAFGPNIVYSGDSTIGTVSSIATGTSFSSDNSSAAAATAESACESAPTSPPTAAISLKFSGPKTGGDAITFSYDDLGCTELLGAQTCTAGWFWNLEATVTVTDDAANWVLCDRILSGSLSYTYIDGSGAYHTVTPPTPVGDDSPQKPFLQQKSGSQIGFWTDSPGLQNIFSGFPIDSGNLKINWEAKACSKTSSPSATCGSKTVDPVCPSGWFTKDYYVNLIVLPGGKLDTANSKANYGTAP